MNLVELNQLSDPELRNLIEPDDETCISLIMPMQQEVDKRDENRIRFKNLLKAARDDLDALGFGQREAEQMLAPTPGIAQGRFPAVDHPGLALYMAQDFSRAYQLPYAPQELVTVCAHFYVKSLMPLRTNEYFYVLVLSQDEIRLLRATQHGVERVALRNLPQSLEEALRWDDPERELQWHSQTAPESDGRAAVFHGHGVGTKESHKENLRRYFQMIDKGISKLLADRDTPLVLAGVDYLLPIYREANTYRHIIEEEITGSHEHLSDTKIQQAAWQGVQPYFREKVDATLSSFDQQASQSLASTELTTILTSAYQGRVETLFVATDEQKWGRFDPETGRIDLHSSPLPGDDDLLNLATIYAVQNKGVVYACQRSDLPGKESAAAILRF